MSACAEVFTAFPHHTKYKEKLAKADLFIYAGPYAGRSNRTAEKPNGTHQICIKLLRRKDELRAFLLDQEWQGAGKISPDGRRNITKKIVLDRIAEGGFN